MEQGQALDPDTLIACPACDLLHRAVIPAVGQRVRCARCRTIIASNRRNAIDRTLASAVAVAILVASALFFPFVTLEGGGARTDATLLDAIRAFSDGMTAPLVLLVAAFIVIVPLTRALLLVWVLWPLRSNRPAWRGAAVAFRMAEELRPWSMAEIFIIGVVVALVKVAGMAEVGLGPAFWMLAALVGLVAVESRNFCRWTVWRTLEARSTG